MRRMATKKKKKIYSWTNAKRKERLKQGKRTMRSWWGKISCRPVFLRITALVHKYECTDENWWILPKRHPGFCAELFLDNANAEFLKEVQRRAEKLVELKWIWIKTYFEASTWRFQGRTIAWRRCKIERIRCHSGFVQFVDPICGKGCTQNITQRRAGCRAAMVKPRR